MKTKSSKTLILSFGLFDVSDCISFLFFSCVLSLICFTEQLIITFCFMIKIMCFQIYLKLFQNVDCLWCWCIIHIYSFFLCCCTKDRGIQMLFPSCNQVGSKVIVHLQGVYIKVPIIFVPYFTLLFTILSSSSDIFIDCFCCFVVLDFMFYQVFIYCSQIPW